MQTRGSAVLKGPADMGKTSCLQFAGDLAEKEGYQVYHYSGHCVSRGENFEHSFKKYIKDDEANEEIVTWTELKARMGEAF